MQRKASSWCFAFEQTIRARDLVMSKIGTEVSRELEYPELLRVLDRVVERDDSVGPLAKDGYRSARSGSIDGRPIPTQEEIDPSGALHMTQSGDFDTQRYFSIDHQDAAAGHRFAVFLLHDYLVHSLSPTSVGHWGLPRVDESWLHPVCWEWVP